MQQDFNVELEDGSITQVAKAMVQLYTECLQGGSPFLEQLRATARSGAAQSQKVGGAARPAGGCEASRAGGRGPGGARCSWSGAVAARQAGWRQRPAAR
jgi:hypothetical protein